MKITYKTIALAVMIILIMFAGMIFLKEYVYPAWKEHISNKSKLEAAEKGVKVYVTPPYKFNFDTMTPGVIQHIDRRYTYDVIPPELINGLLFQGIHRPSKGTAIKFELLLPTTVYFFFHNEVDGGYSEIFTSFNNWERSDVFPQYDIHNGDHGLKMVMYKLEAEPGTYHIPPTTKDRACFSIVFQPKGESRTLIPIQATKIP